MVDAPVVQGTDDRLGEGLGRWCESMCERAASCGAADDPETCPDDCAEYFSETFIGKTDVCSEGALRVMDCLDSRSCDAIIEGECHLDDEADRCAVSQGAVVCRGWDGEGDSGGADGSAGTAGTGNTASVLCEFGISNCSDDKAYRVVCSADGVCRCLVDDAPGLAFGLEALECPDLEWAIAVCGWPIVNVRDDTDAPGAACSSHGGASGGTGSNVCSLSFSDCDNGRTYSLECDGTPGAGECACLIDGETIGKYARPQDVCPYVTGESDSDVLAIYEACGFEIVAL